MSDEDGEALYYITKEEFKKRIAGLNVGLAELGKRYTTLMLKTKSEKQMKKYQQETEDLTEDMNHNLEMMRRADIEEGLCLFWVDMENSVKMRRCSNDEYKSIYTRKNKISYVY